MTARPSRDGYWLEEQMVDLEPDEIEAVFTWDPPTNMQLVVLGLEEMHGRNRADVYRLLARYKR